MEFYPLKPIIKELSSRDKLFLIIMILSTMFLAAMHAVCFGKISDDDFQKEFVDKKRGWFFN